ncbi:MAG: type II toxin-antitoxin system VapC family toxin [Terrimicrobiaceae bacterium]
MNAYLLDTCTFIWLTSAPGQLSREAVRKLESASHTRHLSMASVWEICLKYRIGKLPLPQAPRYWIEEQARLQNIEILDLARESLYRSTELPAIHSDPFDRLIAAEGLVKNLPVITPDQPFKAYGCKTIW